MRQKVDRGRVTTPVDSPRGAQNQALQHEDNRNWRKVTRTGTAQHNPVHFQTRPNRHFQQRTRQQNVSQKLAIC